MIDAGCLCNAGGASAFRWRCLVVAMTIFALAGCSSLLPKSESLTDSPWQSFEGAQHAFGQIVPHQTTVADLRRLKLDPAANPNITILNYSDVLRRFIPNPSIDASALDAGVQECVSAATHCQGYEVDHRAIRRNRYGNFWADILNFRRKTEIVGWRFNAVLLIIDDVVVYKLIGGQPVILEHEENNNPLGPLQGAGEAIFK
ncbi:MAG: hypothetical protein A3G25_17875 [Betaproteobacteria bacterium RIFCSPLOWO2_12_FULL_63_13]|nr:MAG: hypothetical protein A3G25_17875 [Betaproteobacteria bacterium RIFCSPLOWO2_12_FULL_63_13]